MSDPQRLGTGIALGLGAAFTWGLYNVGADLGRTDGFRPPDLTLLRYLVPALVLWPVLLRGTGRPSLVQAVVLAALVGPGFAMLFNLGFRFAPLSHAVVIGPGVTMLVAQALTHLSTRTRPSRARVTGIGILLVSLLLIASELPPPRVEGVPVLLGDVCFVGSGSLWGVYTFLMGRWRMAPMAATAAIAGTSSLVFLPIYLGVWGIPRMPAGLWAEQIVFQGVIGGALAFVIFAATVNRLGAGRAALFPALVPMTAALMAIPITGHVPPPVQWIAIALATAGLAISLDLRAQMRVAAPAPVLSSTASNDRTDT